MKQKKYTQTQQVIDVLHKCGGYSTLGNLYHLVDTSSWGTDTPYNSIRRIVQQSDEIFKIRPGLWALEECRDEVLRKFDIDSKESAKESIFTHGYYQGLIILIGKMKHFSTYVPVDVIWFNERKMPDSFFEVEHTTDIQNSVAKFCDLRDFYSRFYIVAPQKRKEQFLKVMNRSAFKEMKDRIKFSSYETIKREYEMLCWLQTKADRI